MAILSIAFRNLRRARLRSALTSLGIVVGIGAVVATTSIGAGARVSIERALSRPESRIVYLGAITPQTTAQASPGTTSAASDGIRPDDYFAIRRAVASISAATPLGYLKGARAKANGRAAEVTVEGLDVDGFEIVPRRLLAGQRFSHFDVKRAASVAVISESLAQNLYPLGIRSAPPLQINRASFIVIGIVDDVEMLSASAAGRADMHVYTPYTSLLQRLDKSAQLSISVQARDVEHVNAVRQSIGDVMEQLRSRRKAEFRTSAALDLIKTYADASLTVARLLAVMGVIALVVGGIGIMNIMLVSVAERTREIGVRLALGTRRRDILRQFLIEAVALSLLGGAAGLVLGWLAAFSITSVNGWPTRIAPSSVLAAVLCSAIVGILFGYHPARRASLLHPVRALRAE